MESISPTITQQRLLNDAVLYAQGSEFATKLHEGIGYALAAEISLTDRAKWAELGAHAVASSLDWVDGKMKDKAVRSASKALFKHELNNRDRKPSENEWAVLNQHGIIDNPRGDERTDKRYFYSLTGALTVRMTNIKDGGTAEKIAANMAVSKLRDDAKGGLRDYAESRGWSTNAKALGKVKTTLHGLGAGALLMPVLDNKLGRKIGTGLISAGTIIGIADYYKYRAYIRRQEQLATKAN